MVYLNTSSAARGEYFAGRGRPGPFLSSMVPTEQTPEAFGCMLIMYWTARIYIVNLENQPSANLRARAHFEFVVGAAAAGAISGAVDRSTENIPDRAGFGIPRYDPSPKGTAPDLSTLVIYLIVGGLIIASALLGL